MNDPFEAGFMKRTMAFFTRAMELKSRMLKDKKTFCKTTCTIDGCKGELHVRLVGRKNHARVWCTGCDLTMME